MSSSLKNERSNFKSIRKKLRAKKSKDRSEARLSIWKSKTNACFRILIKLLQFVSKKSRHMKTE